MYTTHGLIGNAVYRWVLATGHRDTPIDGVERECTGTNLPE